MNNFFGFYYGSGVYSIMMMLILLWSIPWKGVALWRAAKRSHTIWFIVFLLLNTAGILEILYIFVFSKMGGQATETNWLKRLWQKILKFLGFRKSEGEF